MARLPVKAGDPFFLTSMVTYTQAMVEHLFCVGVLLDNRDLWLNGIGVHLAGKTSLDWYIFHKFGPALDDGGCYQAFISPPAHSRFNLLPDRGQGSQ